MHTPSGGAGYASRTAQVLRKKTAITMAMLMVGLSGCSSLMISPPDRETSQAIVALARTQIGKPYRYGGRGPAGFDCSGLVYYVYKKIMKMRLPRTSAGLYAYSKPIPLGQEQPSDLLFFRINGNRISHVGIYLGKGRFVHAPSRGKHVTISNANDRYWRKRFAGVRRLLR